MLRISVNTGLDGVVSGDLALFSEFHGDDDMVWCVLFRFLTLYLELTPIIAIFSFLFPIPPTTLLLVDG